MRRPLVLRGRRLRGPSGHVQRDDLVSSQARRCLGLAQFGVLRRPLVLRGRRLRGPSGRVQRDDLVSSQARRCLGLAQFGVLRDEFVLRGRRLRGPIGHVRWDNLVHPAIDGPVRPPLLFGLLLVERLLRRRELRWRRGQLRRVGVGPVGQHRPLWWVDGSGVCRIFLHRGGPLRQLLDLRRLGMVDAHTARPPRQPERRLMLSRCILCGRRQ